MMEPTFVELYEQIKSDELLDDFLRRYGLIFDPPIVGYTRKGTPYHAVCSNKPFNPSKPNCTGFIVHFFRDGLPKYRCTVCHNTKSAHNGMCMIDPTVPAGKKTFFCHTDKKDRPNRKVPYAGSWSYLKFKIDPRDVVYMAWLTAYQLKTSFLTPLVGCTVDKGTWVDWNTYLNELMKHELDSAQPLGGPGMILEIDETYLKGRRKSNRGRLLGGNLANPQGNRQNNYLARSGGPWVFGIHCRFTKEVRMFHVPDRSAATLLPIIQKHIAPGATIYSDEWTAYNCLSQNGYYHEKVNHSVNFVDPRTGCHTQNIERDWRTVKGPLVRMGSGVVPGTIDFHLARYWWYSVYGKGVCNNPFQRIVSLIGSSYPV